MGTLEEAFVFMLNSIFSRASQLSRARSIPSNAIAHAFVSGTPVHHGVTVQAKPSGASTISLVGSSF